MFGGEITRGRLADGGDITRGELECPATAPGGGGGAPGGGGEIVGILRMDPSFNLLTTSTIDRPVENASAAVSGSWLNGSCIGPGAVAEA